MCLLFTEWWGRRCPCIVAVIVCPPMFWTPWYLQMDWYAILGQYSEKSDLLLRLEEKHAVKITIRPRRRGGPCRLPKLTITLPTPMRGAPNIAAAFAELRMVTAAEEVFDVSQLLPPANWRLRLATAIASDGNVDLNDAVCNADVAPAAADDTARPLDAPVNANADPLETSHNDEVTYIYIGK